MSVKVSMKVVRSIISKHIVDSINKPAILDCLVKTFDSHALEMLVDICVSEEEFLPLQINDIVMFNDICTVNHLDHGLCDDLNNRYAIITGSDNYGDDFNSYYYKMNLQMFDLDEDNQFVFQYQNTNKLPNNNYNLHQSSYLAYNWSNNFNFFFNNLFAHKSIVIFKVAICIFKM